MTKHSHPTDTAPPIIVPFLGYLSTVTGKSPKTVQEYYLDLRTFFRYMKRSRGLVPADVPFSDIDISDIDLALVRSITLSDVYEYMNFLSTTRGNAEAARARKVSSLRTFFKYLTIKANLLERNPIEELETPKLKKSLPKYLTLEQSQQLLHEPTGRNKERDYCMLTLFLNCGIRLSELCGINLGDIGSDHTLRVTGKGNKERVVYLNNACLDAIDTYLRVRPREGLKDRNALFISGQHQRISNKTVQNIVKQYLIDIGLDDYSTHKLRHTAATLMYQYGHVDVRVLQEILGHENLGTTQIYTHLSNKQLQDAAKANPLSHMSARTEFDPSDEKNKT